MLLAKSIILTILIAISFIAISGCGKKSALYLPTEQQQRQLDKEQQQRDAILKKRQQQTLGTP